VNRFQSFGKRLQVIDDAHIFGALREHVQMDETKPIFISPEDRDDTEILLLCQIDARIEAASELWNQRGQC